MNTIEGPLSFATVTPWFGRVPALLQSATIDLGGVTHCDSAGAALLLELQRQAQAQNRPLTFRNTPQQLRELLTFFGVDKLFKLAT